MPSEVTITSEHCHHLATVITGLLDRIGALEGLLEDAGYETGDDRTDRILIGGQRIAHEFRRLATGETE